MSRWSRDTRSMVDLVFILVLFVALGGATHLVTGHVVSATIAGAALGFIVSESARWRRERAQGRWVRRALRLEFQHNLTGLAAIWNESNAARTTGQGSLTAVQTRFFVDIFPLWSRALWISQVGQVGYALTDEEITEAMDLQSEYDRLMALRDRVLSHAGDDPASLRIDPDDWAAIEALTATMLQHGNPIQ